MSPLASNRRLGEIPWVLSVMQYKMLSYRRETALQGALVLAKSRRLELGDNIFVHHMSIFNHCDIIGLQSYRIRWKKMQNKGYYVVQGHWRSSTSVPIESPYATSYWWLIVTGILSRTIYRSLLFKLWTFCVFEPPLGGLGIMYDVYFRVIGKRVVDFLLVLLELFSLGVTAEALRAKIIDWKSAISLQRGHFDPNFQVEGVAPTSQFCMDS